MRDTLALVLVLVSLSAACAPSPPPTAADRPPTSTPAPIGTVVTPVSVVLSITPAPPPSGVVLVNISTATPVPASPGAAASPGAPPSPAPSPAAAAATATSAPATAASAPAATQQPPPQIASSGRVTSAQLSTTQPVSLPCPDPRVTIGVPAVPPSNEVQLSCQSLDASEVPPPGTIVGGMVFRVFTDRAADTTLPTDAALGIAYGDASIESAREGDLVIGHLQGTSWMPVPGQKVDQPSDYASATIRELGTYALYLRS